MIYTSYCLQLIINTVNYNCIKVTNVTVATIEFDRTCRELRGAYFTEAKEPNT